MKNSISSLHGVGKVRAASYARLGVNTVKDLLFHYPRAYENRGDTRPLVGTAVGEKQATILTIATEPRISRIRRGMNILKFRAYDESATCEITYFNQDYLKSVFALGKEFRFYGKIEKTGNRYTMSSPAYEEYTESKKLMPLMPLYPLTDGISQNQIKANIAEALSIAATELRDPIPEAFRLSHKLPTLLGALHGIHAPETFEELNAAKNRLVYDELFLFALAMRTSAKKQKESGAKKCLKRDISKLLNLLPYDLTNGQKCAIRDISSDISGDIPMSRILVGDVGCGKTICAAAAMYMAVQNGYQAALMAPTEILARQHYADLAPLFEELGIKVTLLVGALTEKQKKEARASLLGDTDIVIGTQALLTETVAFRELALIVIDEQHRFGANQRKVLAEKDKHTHVLAMSATPIPRSLALTLYGDLDISRIEEIPSGRQPVDTFVVDESYRERLNGFIRKQVNEGGQVYIVCPAVEESENEAGEVAFEDIFDLAAKPPLKSAIGYAEALQSTLPDLNIAFVHGKMKSAEKDRVMTAFAEGKIQVLVSTTVIEVGVNVPNACLMIVENAERFGLSQLHQLRGRVGRGSRKSYCVLVSDVQRTSTAYERLQTLERTRDGFKIAEKDLSLRGPGDFLRVTGSLSLRQSGALTFRIADLCRNNELLTSAFADADFLLGEDAALEKYPTLREEMLSRFFPDATSIS